MKRFRLVALLALSLPVALTSLAAQAPAPKPATAKPAAKPAGAARTVEITGGDDMDYVEKAYIPAAGGTSSDR